MPEETSIQNERNEEIAEEEANAQEEEEHEGRVKKQRQQKKKGPSTEVKVLQRALGIGAGCLTSSLVIVFAITLAVAVGFSLIHPDSAGGSLTACSTPVACAVPGDIVQTAEKLAWPDGSHGVTPRDIYLKAMIKAGTSGDPTDCGRFVATVMRVSGADPNYPPVGVVNQWPYVQSHPKLYQIISTNLTNTSQLQPGDILYSQTITSGIGHTAIYIGRQSGEATNTLSASLGGHAPEANSDWYGAGAAGSGDAGGMVKAARYIGGK